jgi:hypothetical protein
VISLADLDATAKMRPQGYRETILGNAVWVSDTHYALTHQAYADLCGFFRPKTPTRPVPREQWGRVVNWFAKHSQAGDRGVGDVIERMIESSSMGRIAKRIVKRMPFDCGCTRRREEWNRLFPL